MDMDTLASLTFSQVPGARLAGVVDMTTGMFLAIEAGNLPQRELDLLAISARELFFGAVGTGLRQSFVGENDRQQLKDVIVVGEKTVFMFARLPQSDAAAIVVACDKKAQLGMITMTIAKIRDGFGKA